MTTEHAATPHELHAAADNLLELAKTFGVGQVNRVAFSTWSERFAVGKSPSAARKKWERLRRTLAAMGAPVHAEREGSRTYLVLGRDARGFATRALKGLSAYFYSEDGQRVLAKSRFVEVRLEDVLPPATEPSAEAVAAMKESIERCPIGLIHPVVLVGEVPPFRLGLGRVRLAACRQLGQLKILARVVSTWAPVIAADENLVREHYGKSDLEHMRHVRDERVACLKAEGLSNRQIAEHLDVSEPTVRRCSAASHDAPERCLGFDDKRYPVSRPTPESLAERRREAKRLHEEEGLSTRQIADRLGVSTGTAHRDLTHEGREEGREWFEIDPQADPLPLCLSAMERGIKVLTSELRAGTATSKRGRQVQQLVLAVAERVRTGRFTPAAQPQLRVLDSEQGASAS